MSDDNLVKRLRMVTGFIRFETGDSACLSEEAADRIEELEAKLAKAVDAIEGLLAILPDDEGPEIDYARTTLSELKGEDRG